LNRAADLDAAGDDLGAALTERRRHRKGRAVVEIGFGWLRRSVEIS
jgi:hypothetical protein